MEYQVVFGETPLRLEARVQRLIQYGWEPIGISLVVGYYSFFS